MHHIVYISRATHDLSPLELMALLVQARRNNERAGITGALVYGDLQFMQVMEGEKAAVTALYERILADPRHQAVLKLADKAIEERTFVNWTMAFREIAPAQVEELQGYISPEHWTELNFVGSSADTLFLENMRELMAQVHNS